MKKIQLSQNQVALVDDEDYEKLIQFKWCARKTDRNIYAVTNSSRKIIPRKTVYMHRMILNHPIGMHVDHIDRNGLNNQRSNLRICTNEENRMNHKKYKNNKTGFNGVVIDKKSFVAQIFVKGKRIYIGCFPTPEDAALAYDKEAIKYFGEFANLNFKI